MDDKQKAFELLTKARDLVEEASRLNLDDWGKENIEDARVHVELALDAIDGHILARTFDRAKFEVWNAGAPRPGDW